MEAERPICYLSVSFLCFFFTLLILGCGSVNAASHSHHHHGHGHRHHHRGGSSENSYSGTKKLFVFGDSYADTGNNPISFASSWKAPYGTTFPGHPTGRYSDGRVVSDFLARYMKIRTPVAYRWRKIAKKRLRYGMNFATGGTGVFETLVQGPNMTTQIDFLEQLTKDSVFNASDLQSSVTLVTLSGNDYNAALAKNGSFQAIQAFIPRVVDQLAVNLKRIHRLGMRKVVVTGLQPLGCLPRVTVATNFQSCNSTQNMAVGIHNLLLQQAVAKFNREAQGSSSPFILLDLYSSFMSVLKNKGNRPGDIKFENPLKQCCMGKSKEDSCGSVDKLGTNMYTVCEDPGSAFFWDTVHPTQAGWEAVFPELLPHLERIWT